jgi:hypothetical protein
VILGVGQPRLHYIVIENFSNSTPKENAGLSCFVEPSGFYIDIETDLIEQILIAVVSCRIICPHSQAIGKPLATLPAPIHYQPSRHIVFSRYNNSEGGVGSGEIR